MPIYKNVGVYKKSNSGPVKKTEKTKKAASVPLITAEKKSDNTSKLSEREMNKIAIENARKNNQQAFGTTLAGDDVIKKGFVPMKTTLPTITDFKNVQQARNSKSTGEYAFDGNIPKARNYAEAQENLYQALYNSKRRKYQGTEIYSLYDGSTLDADERKFLENEKKIFDDNQDKYFGGQYLRRQQEMARRKQAEADAERKKAFNEAMSLETGEFRDLSQEDLDKKFVSTTQYNEANRKYYEQKAKRGDLYEQQEQAEFDYAMKTNSEKYAEEGRKSPEHPLNAREYATGSNDVTLYSNERAYSKMTEEEKKYVDALYGYYKDSPNTATQIFNKLLAEKENEAIKEEAKTNWFSRNVKAPVRNAYNNFFGGIVYSGDTIAQEIKNEMTGIPQNVPDYSPGTTMLESRDSMREAFVNGDKGVKGKAKELMLDTVNSFTPALTGPAAPYVYALQSGGDAAYETTKKGGSNGQALAMGIGNGIVGYFASKGPFDTLFEGKGAISAATKKALENDSKGAAKRLAVELGTKYIGKQAMEEGLEEFAESYANTFLDVLINGDNSDISLEYNTLLKTGKYTEAQARQMVLTNKIVKEPVLSAAYGALMGGLMGAGNVGFSTVSGAFDANPNVKGNVGYDVNGQTYREDGSVTNEFDLAGTGADVQHSKKLGGYIPENNATTEGVLEHYGIKNIENKYEVINKVANKLKESYLSTEELRKPITNIDTGMNIEIWKGGINETFGNDEYFSSLPIEDRINKIAVMPYLANMIKYGEVRAPEAGNDYNPNSKVTYAYLESQINVDGNPYTVNMDIRKSPNGENRFYIHSLNVKKGDNHLAHNVEQSKDGQTPFYNNVTTNDGKSQYEIKYTDGEVKNTPFADKFEGIDTDSLFNENKNDTGNDRQNTNPVGSGVETDADAEGIIAPKEAIAQIPKANRAMMNVWSKRTGAKILVAGTKAATGTQSDGAYSRSKDTIVIDWKTAKSPEAFARKILTHEGVHSVEASEFYNELKDYAFNNLYANEEAKSKAIADKIKQYGDENVELDTEAAEKELVADYLSEHILSSEKAINKFCRQSPSLAKNVYWSLKKAYSYLTDKQSFKEIKNIEKGLEIFEKTLGTRTMGDEGNGNMQFSNPVASTDLDAENDIKISSKKAENYYNRYSNTAKKDIGKIFGIPKSRLGAIDGDFDRLAGEYFKNGKISEESKNTLFEKAWKEGIIVDDSNAELLKGLRKDLKASKLYISPDEAHDIPDFGAWRRGQIGNMYISTANGYPVDSKYSELSQMYPDLFPDNITAPSDQLLKIAEVMESLKPDEYTLEERAFESKEEYKTEFMKGLKDFEKRLSDVSRYEKARELTDVQNVYGRDELTVEEANNIYAELKNARKNYEKVMNKELLTDADKKKVEQVLAGDIDIEDINPDKYNVEGIKKAAEARAPVELLNGALDKHKKAVKARRFETAEKFLEGSDFWKEKKTGFSYARETMERNIYDIMGKGNEKKAKEFNDHYFAPVHEHEAQSIRNKNAYRQRVANLKLSDKIQKGNTTSERFAVQFLGEVESDLERLSRFKTNGIFNKKVGTKTHFATQQEVDRYIDYAYMYAYETNELENKEFPKQNDKIIISKADDRLINDVKEAYGIDLSEAYHVLNDNDIRHIKNSHGEDTNEKYPVTAEDLKQIPDIIKNYDDVICLPRAGKTGLYYVKRHNGVTYYLESINDEGTALTNKQMIKVSTGTIPDIPGLKDAINKKWNINSAPNDSNVPRMYVQDVKNPNVPTDIVAQNKRVVNPIEKSRTQKILELRKQREIFLKENPNLDYDKINNAISEFRKIYDELFESMNDARIRNGYNPVEYRQGYFPHFLTDGKKGIKPEVATELGIGDYDEVGGIFEKFTKALGISTDVNKLPTNIAGKTQDFKPGIKFMTEALQRKGNKTDYDAVAGFDRYIESVSDVIYHTDDIQELRALERQLRYEYSEAGVKEQIDKIKDNALLDEDVKNEALDRLYERNISKHGNLAQELSEYTNLLANKKSKYDRNVEGLLNRKVYNVLNWANKNVAGNMIAGNLSSAMTNFIPITQASAECSQSSILKATRDTIKSFLHNDGFSDSSTFLTNRKGSELLTKSTSTKISDVLSTPMEFVDMFTSNVVTRAKFYENIKNGMDVDAAIKDADSYAAGLIADRSKGSLPTVFGAKNPLFKTFTMFQVEVNNQLSYLGKDLPRAKRNKAITAIAGALFKYFIGAYLYNDIYEKLVGRRPALDAIGFANDISGDIFGVKLPNVIDAAAGLINGDGVDFDAEKKKPSEALKNIATSVTEDVPFVGGVMGGGRVPISSALPDVGELSKILDSDVSGKKKADIALKEGSKALYGVVPFGLNQAKKTYQGIKTVKDGGSYSMDKEGNKQLQYPVYNDSTKDKTLNYIQGALFGKSALPEAQEWRKSGYKSMSVKDTERYEKIAAKGYREDTFNLLNNIRAIESVKNAKGETVESISEQRYKAIKDANIPEGQKAWLEISYWGDKAKARAEAAKKDAKISNKQYVDAKYKYSESDAEKYNSYLTNRQKKVFELTPQEEKASDYKKFSLFNEKGLTAEQKRYLEKDLLGSNGKTDYTDKESFYLSLLSDSQNAKFEATKRALGVNAEMYYTYLKIAADGKKDEKKAKLQQYGMNPAQANAFYELAIKNRKAGDVHDRTAYAGLSAKEQAAYNLLKNYREYLNMDAAEFSVFVRAAASGKTEAEKIEILRNYSLNGEKLSEIAAKGIVRALAR